MCCYLVTAGAKIHIFIGVSIARGIAFATIKHF